MSEKIIEAINGLDHLCVLLPATIVTSLQIAT